MCASESIAPFAAVLLRSESAASSQIENLTASARAIAEAELPGVGAKRNAEMIVANGRQLVSELRDIRTSWNDDITARSDSAVWKVADLLSRRPVINAALLAQELGIETTNAHRYLTPLTEAGILIESTNQRRNRIWRAPDILAAPTPSPTERADATEHLRLSRSADESWIFWPAGLPRRESTISECPLSGNLQCPMMIGRSPRSGTRPHPRPGPGAPTAPRSGTRSRSTRSR